MPNDPVLAAAVQRATDAVAHTAASPNNAMNPTAVAEAQPQLHASIEAAIAPVIANATNTEAHWWQKRSRWSAIGSSFAALGFIAGPVLEYMRTHTTDSGSTTVSAFGLAMAVWAGYSAYRAGRATTPLGTPAMPSNPVKYRG